MRRFKLQFSLLTAFLLTTIAAMAIVIALQWNEVGPLRAEVRRLRTEFGYLNIDDPTKACAIQLPTGEPRHWRWRVYLPPGPQYVRFSYSGTLPSPKELERKAWFDRLEHDAAVAGIGGAVIDGGEFTLDATLEKEGDRWELRTTESGGRGWGRNFIRQPSGDWLSNPEGFSLSGEVRWREQTVFEPGGPILLLKALKPVIIRFPSGYRTRAPEGEAEGFVLWIEKLAPAPAPKAATP